MKRKLIISLVLSLHICSASYAASIADPDNPHNMSNLADNVGPKAAPNDLGGTDQICVFCHTPHSATPDSPLWNRPDPIGPNGDGTFPVYGQTLGLPLGIKDDPSLTGYGTADYPNGASRMCLSCHDGATSIGVLLGGAPIVMLSGSETITNPAAVIDLETSHPVSFKYNQTVIDTLLDPSAYQLPDGTVDTPLDKGQMQCTTCHDPHVDTRNLPGYDGLPFWRHQADVLDLSVSRYDDVCNACHTDRGAAVTPAPLPPTHPGP